MAHRVSPRARVGSVRVVGAVRVGAGRRGGGALARAAGERGRGGALGGGARREASVRDGEVEVEGGELLGAAVLRVRQPRRAPRVAVREQLALALPPRERRAGRRGARRLGAPVARQAGGLLHAVRLRELLLVREQRHVGARKRRPRRQRGQAEAADGARQDGDAAVGERLGRERLHEHAHLGRPVARQQHVVGLVQLRAVGQLELSKVRRALLLQQGGEHVDRRRLGHVDAVGEAGQRRPSARPEREVLDRASRARDVRCLPLPVVEPQRSLQHRPQLRRGAKAAVGHHGGLPRGC